MTTAYQDFDNHTENRDDQRKLVDRSHNRHGNKSFVKTITTEPQPHSWSIVAVGAVVPVGLAAAALTTSYLTSDKQVAVAAWVAVAIVGTASVISAAAVSHRRVVSTERERGREANTDKQRNAPI